ncbi:MAG TPA: uroporphyrinogen-III synthase [Xanthobacteraceae bacterium]|nr:uroporphyrinogen-III synthase [Xanthobacteraceae bacterium]
MRILVTRPEPDAAKTAARLRAAGHAVLIDSLLVIEPVAFDPPRGEFAALAITSASAPRMAGNAAALAGLKSLPLFAVGAHSAAAARAAGFAGAEAAGGDAQALAGLIARRLPAGARVLYLAGETRARDLAGLTAPAGIEFETRIVYRARPAERFADATVSALRAGEIDAVLHFSPRSAEVFASLARQAGLAEAVAPLRHLCLSAAVAAPLAAMGGRTEVAIRPDEEAMLALLGL